MEPPQNDKNLISLLAFGFQLIRQCLNVNLVFLENYVEFAHFKWGRGLAKTSYAVWYMFFALDKLNLEEK